jgi:Ca2+-transporting ATPase
MTTPHWTLGTQELEAALRTDAGAGLTSSEAHERRRQHGPNQLQQQQGQTAWGLLLDQFRDFMIWVLIGAAVVSGVMREWVDAVAIVLIVVLNAVLGFIQEYRAERSLAALRKLASPTSKVVRDGQVAVLRSADLVPGDLIEIEAGDHVPADARVVQHTAGFRVQEASLTGESEPVAKGSQPLESAEVPLAERTNMLFMGTSVVSGRGRALVVSTGMETELGRIAGMIQSVRSEETPLQRKLAEFGRLTVKVCFVLVAVVFALQWLRGGKTMEVFLSAVSLAVAAIPEGLPAVVTIALALGVQRMVRRNALIRRLPSVETLGCATVICSDKTGTLTRNVMTVLAVRTASRAYGVSGVGYEPRGEFREGERAVDAASDPVLVACLRAGALCNAAQLVEEDGVFRIVGDPTEGALLACAAKAGLRKEELERAFAYVEEIPFDSARKKMSVVRRDRDGRLIAFVKGAPDVLLRDCRAAAEGDGERPLTAADRARILDANAAFSRGAMRVLAVATRRLDALPDAVQASDVENDLTFLGLMAMIDPPRPEAREAVATCQAAGIRVVMITGDHRDTAAAVGEALGLRVPGSLAVTGEELDRWSDEDLARQVDAVSVYARVSPAHKLRVVRALRQRGRIVAMTGDGVNDAPAVKEADIGVAMAITGTDVTKEVSDMVITDDNFASIVAAVEEGRGIYDNILKFVHYLLSCNAGEILVMFLASLAGMPVPLLPVQILWVNLVTDSLPALALGMDPVDRGVMKRQPRDPAEPVVGRRDGLRLLTQGAALAVGTLLAFYVVLTVWGDTLPQARAAAFMVLAFSQLAHAFNCRSRTQSIFRLGFLTNRALLAAVVASVAVQAMLPSVPLLQRVFQVQPLGWREWGLVALLSSFPLWAMEGVKAIERRKARRAESR